MQVEPAETTPPAEPASPWLLATTGSTWPHPLACSGRPQPLDATAVERCGEADQPVWLGYANPLHLLQNPELQDPAAALEQWCQEARWLLEIHQRCSDHCRLLNLPLLAAPQADSAPGSEVTEPHATAPEPPAPAPGDLDPRLAVLALRHPDLQNLYADLEGCADLEGRQPEFQLGLPPLRSQAFAEHCLASWQRQKAQQQHQQEALQLLSQERDQILNQQLDQQKELAEAREEAELTLLQLHQVQEELETIFLQHREASGERDQFRQQVEELQGQQEELQQLRQLRDQGLKQQEELQQLRQLRDQGLAEQKLLAEAREEAELTLLQLHQVQEELEHYFLEHRKVSQELEQQREALEGLQQEARLLFVHSTPRQGLNRSHLHRIAELMRESLELK